MSKVWSDLRHGVRGLLRTPLFTICTIAADRVVTLKADERNYSE